MRRVSCQEHAPDAVAIHHADCGLIHRPPGNAPDATPGGSMHHSFEIRSNRLRLRRQLEKRCVRQWAKTDRATLGEGPNVPVAAIESVDL